MESSANPGFEPWTFAPQVDLDIHSYAYFARKAFGSYYPRLEPVVFENGFVVQGNRWVWVAIVLFESPRPLSCISRRLAFGRSYL